MRLGVLDIGSNTGHLLVVDAYRGAAPMPASSYKEPLRLAEHLDEDGTVSDKGVDALTEFVGHALELAEDKGCEEIYSFATSAVRDADNSDEVLAHVEKRTGVDIKVLPGEDEARLDLPRRTPLVRLVLGPARRLRHRWRLAGDRRRRRRVPDVAWSLPLGAGRLTREHFADGPPGEKALRKLRKEIRTQIAHDAGALLRGGAPDHAVATSKTFRSLARICGVGALQRGPVRTPDPAGLRAWRSGSPSCSRWSRDEIADLPGVSASRAHQVVAGALVASAVLDIFDLEELEICPWALREGVILDRLDQLSALG